MLVLFDIDGTLLSSSGRAHKLAVARAVGAVYGRDVPDDAVDIVRPGGKTDVLIARQIALAHGVEAGAFEAGIPAFRTEAERVYADLADGDLGELVLDGAREALEQLAVTGAATALVTGNLEAIAHDKLGRAGIGGFFAPGEGAFGSDAEQRDELVPIALERATCNGSPWPAQRAVVVGDAPADVRCARAAGARAVAVTTGPFAPADLSGADAVIGNLRELPGRLAAL